MLLCGLDWTGRLTNVRLTQKLTQEQCCYTPKFSRHKAICDTAKLLRICLPRDNSGWDSPGSTHRTFLGDRYTLMLCQYRFKGMMSCLCACTVHRAVCLRIDASTRQRCCLLGPSGVCKYPNMGSMNSYSAALSRQTTKCT